MPITDENPSAGIFKAFIAAQAEITAVQKDRVNPQVNARYATLDSVWDMLRPILARHGLGVYQQFKRCKAGVLLTTLIMHDSGAMLPPSQIFMPVPATIPRKNKADEWIQIPTPNLAWEFGKNATYARRYGLLAAFGIVADEDTDAATPSVAPERRYSKAPSKPTPKENPDAPLSPDRAKAFVAWWNKLDSDAREKAVTLAGVAGVDWNLETAEGLTNATANRVAGWTKGGE